MEGAVERSALRVLQDEMRPVQPRILFAQLLAGLLPRGAFGRVRAAIYRLCGVRLQRGSMLLGPIELVGGGDVLSRFRVGTGCIINSPFYADVSGEVSIGDRVSIGHHCTIITSSHAIGPSSNRAGPMKPEPVVVEDGCWLGAGVTVLPGVKVGKGSVVGPGSLVAADVPPNKLVGGVPARVIKALE